MAYVLGYFAADGCVSVNSRGAQYVHFDSTDRNLLMKIRQLLGSHHAISVKRTSHKSWKPCYLLQIGSREMVSDLACLGFAVRKGHRLAFPKIPLEFLSDFIRGYFDGDGGISYGMYRRKNKTKKTRVLLVRFTSESVAFLKALREILVKQAGMGFGSLISYGTYACLSYAYQDSVRLFYYMYGRTGPANKVFLDRKYRGFLEGFQLYPQGAVV